MQLKICFLFGKILFGTRAHEDNLVLVNADSSCMYLSQHTFIIILIKRPLSALISCSGRIWRHKTIMVYNWCQRVHDCVAVSFSFLTNANLGLLSTEIASTIHLSRYAMWTWLKTEGAHVPSPPSPPPLASDAYVDVSYTKKK